MKRLILILSIVLLLLSCDNGNMDEPTFTVTYSDGSDLIDLPQNSLLEIIGAYPVDNTKYKTGDIVILMDSDLKIRDKTTLEIEKVFCNWFSFDYGDVHAGDTIIVKEKNIIFYPVFSTYWPD